MPAGLEYFGGRSPEPFYRFDAQVPDKGFGFLHPQVGYLEVLVVEAVEQEVQKIRNYRLSALALQKLHQIVVGGGQEFHQDLAHHAYPWFFDIQKFNVVVKVCDNLLAEFLEPAPGWMRSGHKFCAHLLPFLMHGVHGARHCLVGPQPVYAFHKDIAEYGGVKPPQYQGRGNLESRVALQSA